MKLLTTRQEMAKAMNFGKYPVLSIDLADSDKYGLRGCKLRIDNGFFRTGEPYFVEADLRVYRDEKKLTTSSYGACIHADFGYKDYKEMVDMANTPLIKADQDVVVAIYDSRTKFACKPMIVHTGKSIRQFCSTPLDFEPVDMSEYLRLAGFDLEEGK